MKRLLFSIAVLLVLSAQSAFAGNPHFVDDQTSCTQTGNTLTCNGKEAGLGAEDQIHVVLSATAQCVNPGGNEPQAANKQSVNAAGDFPVQNGKAYFTLSVAATFKPSCSPPMTVEFSDITITDTTSGISLSL